jgi:putative DNA primase/helicase
MTQTRIDFKSIASAALSRAEILISAWLPGGRNDGKEYIALNPTRGDKTPGSFRINIGTGSWADFAGTADDRGRDLISLYRYINGCSMADAARAVSEACGNTPTSNNPPSADDTWKIVIPVPPEASAPPTERRLKIAGAWVGYPLQFKWEYRDAVGAVLGYDTRYETPTGKETPTLTLWRNQAGLLKWRFRGFPTPRPMYGLHALSQHPAAQVIVVEGCKCAEVLQGTADAAGADIVAVTWPGGVNGVSKADFGPLRGRRVVLWPDFDLQTAPDGTIRAVEDQPGYRAMVEVSRVLAGLQCDMRMIYPVSGKPDGWDVADAVLHDGWGFTEITEFIRQNLRSVDVQPAPAPVAPTPEHPVQAAPAPSRQPESTFRCLGYSHGSYYYLPRGTHEVTAIAAANHSPGTLMGLAPLSHWERQYPGEKGPAWRMASDDLMRSCERIGPYSPLLVRGRGAWLDSGRVVLHLGNRLLVDGKPTTLSEHKSPFVYEASVPLAFSGADPLPVSKSRKIRDVFSSLFWARPIDATLISGWCVIAPICGAMPHRPHVWLTGDAGSGKTYCIENIILPLLGEFCLPAQSATTEAGVRQILGCDALPVTLDEFESDDDVAKIRIQKMLELARQAFSDGSARIYKGGATGRATSFAIRSSFLMSSISVVLSQHADETRVSVLSLNKPHDIDGKTKKQHFAELSKLVTETLTPKWCAALRARTFGLIPQIRANAKEFTLAIADKIGNRRAGDQIGPMIAGSYSLVSDGLVTQEFARDWVEKQDWTAQTDVHKESDSGKILNHIMQYQIREPGKVVSIFELIEEELKFTDNWEGSDTAGNRILKRHGIKVESKERVVYIATVDSCPVSRILKQTQWEKSFGRILDRMPGVIQGKRLRFNGPAMSCVGVPAADLGVE